MTIQPSERPGRATGVQTRRKGPHPSRPCAVEIPPGAAVEAGISFGTWAAKATRERRSLRLPPIPGPLPYRQVRSAVGRGTGADTGANQAQSVFRRKAPINRARPAGAHGGYAAGLIRLLDRLPRQGARPGHINFDLSRSARRLRGAALGGTGCREGLGELSRRAEPVRVGGGCSVRRHRHARTLACGTSGWRATGSETGLPKCAT